MIARALVFGAGLTALCAVSAMAQTELATGPFTAAQSEAGRAFEERARAAQREAGGDHEAEAAGVVPVQHAAYNAPQVSDRRFKHVEVVFS